MREDKVVCKELVISYWEDCNDGTCLIWLLLFNCYFAYYFRSLHHVWLYWSSILCVLLTKMYQRDCAWMISAVRSSTFVVILLIVFFYFFMWLPPICYILACVYPSGKSFQAFLPFVASISFFLRFPYFSLSICPLRCFSLSPTFSISFLAPLLPLSSVSTPSSFRGYGFLLSIRSSTWIQTRPFAWLPINIKNPGIATAIYPQFYCECVQCE